jgi:hypothetical protein
MNINALTAAAFTLFQFLNIQNSVQEGNISMVLFTALYRLSEEEIQTKVNAYRNTLMGNNSQNGSDQVKDDYGRPM